jgi:hypothetical protein
MQYKHTVHILIYKIVHFPVACSIIMNMNFPRQPMRDAKRIVYGGYMTKNNNLDLFRSITDER